MAGCCLKLVLGFQLLVVLITGGFFWAVLTDRFPPAPPLPDLPDIRFGDVPTTTDQPWPFKINVSESDLKDLRSRLASDLKRLGSVGQESLKDTFEDGMNSRYLTQILGPYWLNKYEWRKSEKRINQMGQHFKINIDGLDVHYVHAKPDPKVAKGKRVVPVLLVHGWPGSFVEFIKLIPLLTKPVEGSDYVFEVVAPSIPGYGFSSPPKKIGFHVGQCGKVFKVLMNRLGFAKFYTQGGDWGAFVTAAMAIHFPDSILGHHTNMAISQRPSSTLKALLTFISPRLVLEPHEDSLVVPYSDKIIHILKETGYFHIQSTRPDTVGIGLTTSPLGLASYVVEKFSSFSNAGHISQPDGNLPQMFTQDEILDNLMVYWLTGSITSSMRFYKENVRFDTAGQHLQAYQTLPISVPAGIANSEEELLLQPKSFLTSKYQDIVTFDTLQKVGHFAAYQAPEKLHNSFRGFVQAVETRYKGKDKKSEL